MFSGFPLGFDKRRTCIIPSAGGLNGFTPFNDVPDAGNNRNLAGFFTLASNWKSLTAAVP